VSVFGLIKTYCRFTWGLRGFLREKITPEQSRKIIKERLQNRQRNLLLLVNRAIYGNKNSPYLKLLNLAGCEYGDFEQMVQEDGVEAALKKIAAEGVYVSVEEFKGKKEAKRGSKAFNFIESDFDNPFLHGHLEVRSGASRSAGTRTVYDFDYLTANRLHYLILTLDYAGVLGFPSAIWWPILPGAGPMVALCHAKVGNKPVRWFTPVEKRGYKPSLKSRVGTNFIIYASRLSGVKLPRPEYFSSDEAWKVAEWMAEIIKQQGGCSFSTYPNLAVRICQAAIQRGIDLTGGTFFLTAEPTTEAKQKEIASSGAVTSTGYAFSEAGFVGLGCLSPAAPDDVHLCKDSLALIQNSREVPHAATSVEAFLFSTLLSSAPKILLNVESGDYGVVEARNCGCKWEKLGLTEHIYQIRGFDKLTSEGMTFIGTDMVRIIEEVLPAKFGGTSNDYQVVEEEDEQGHTRMSVIASPELGAIDEVELIKVILHELSKGTDRERLMAEGWTQAKTLRVQRRQPFATARGKLMPLHIYRHK
jgi:hypothetical protein